MTRTETALVPLLLLVGCAGEEVVEPPPETPGIALSELCAEVARVDCERLDSCGLLVAPVDLETCEVRQTAVLCAPVEAAISAAVDAETLAYFELSARDCRKAISERACDFGFDYDLLDLPQCAAMLEARGGEGAACHLSDACMDNFWCDPGMMCPGTCRALKQNNESCGFTDICAAGLFCGVTSRRCLAQVDIGSDCEPPLSGNSCRPGGFCDMTQPAMPECRRVRGRGEGCQSSNECIVGDRCIRNRCSGGEVGDTCDEPFHCDTGLVCADGTCAARLDAGATCIPTGVPCRVGFECVGGMAEVKCLPTGGPGAMCRVNSDCFLGRCEGDMCIAALEDGAECTSATQCLPDRSCDSVCIPPVRSCAR